jgi:hypothetical protein
MQLSLPLSPSLFLSLPLSPSLYSSLSLTGEQGAHTLFGGQREREKELVREREREREKELARERDKERRKKEG